MATYDPTVQSVLDEVFRNVGRTVQTGGEIPNATDMYDTIQTMFKERGLDVSPEAVSALIGREMPAVTPGLIGGTKMAVNAGLNTAVASSMESGADLVKAVSNLPESMARGLTSIFGTDSGEEMAPPSAEPTPIYDNVMQDVKRIREKAGDQYQPQGTMGKLGMGLVEGVGELAPTIALAETAPFKWGAAAISGKLKSASGIAEGMVPKIMSDTVKWAKYVGAEEAGYGMAFGIAAAFSNDKVLKPAAEGNHGEALRHAVVEVFENTVYGTALGLGMRAVFSPAKAVWEAMRGGRDIDKTVAKDPFSPSDLTVFSRQEGFYDPQNDTLIAPVRDLLAQIKMAGANGDQEGLAKATGELSLMNPELLSQAVRVLGDEIGSLHASLYEYSYMGRTLAERMPGYLRAEDMRLYNAHKLLHDMNGQIMENRGNIERLMEMLPNATEEYKTAILSDLNDVQRDLNVLMNKMDPAFRNKLDILAQGGKLSPADEAAWKAGWVANNMRLGILQPDISNPAMAQLRGLVIWGEMADTKFYLTAKRQGIDLIQELSGPESLMKDIREEAKNVDLEGIISRLGNPNDRYLRWDSMMGELIKRNPKEMEGLLTSTIDANQFMEGLKGLMRKEFQGDKGTLVQLLSGVDEAITLENKKALQNAVVRNFPGTFGDINPREGADVVERGLQGIREGLVYGMGIDKQVGEAIFRDHLNSLEMLYKTKVLTPEAYQEYKNILGFAANLYKEMFRDSSAYPGALGGFGKLVDQLNRELGALRGDLDKTTGAIRLTGLSGDMSHVSAEERNNIIYTFLHETAHAIVLSLPQDVREGFFRYVSTMMKDKTVGYEWLYNAPYRLDAAGELKIPGYMLESAHEAMAELLAKGIAAHMTGDREVFRSVFNGIPMSNRVSLIESLTKMASNLDGTPFAGSAAHQVLRVFRDVGDMIRMESDPFYVGLLDELTRKLNVPDNVMLKNLNQTTLNDVRMVKEAFGGANNAFDKEGRLTPEGKAFAETQYGVKFEDRTDFSEVVTEIHKQARENAQSIKQLLPEGKEDAQVLLARFVRNKQEILSRMDAPGASEFYSQGRFAGVREYLNSLSDNVFRTGGVWAGKDKAEMLKGYGDLERITRLTEDIKNNMRGENPRMWDNMDYTRTQSWLMDSWKTVRNSPWLKKHFGEQNAKDLTQAEANLMTSQWLAKKHPVLGSIFDQGHGMGEMNNTLQYKLLTNEGDVLNSKGGAPVMDYLSLGRDPTLRIRDPKRYQTQLNIRDATEFMLHLGNDYANALANRGSIRKWDRVERDGNYNFLDKEWLFNEVRSTDFMSRKGMKDISSSELERAYEMYKGINAYRKFINEEMGKTIAIRRGIIGDNNELAKLRQEIGRLGGSIAQSREGSHAIRVYDKDGELLLSTFFDGGPLAGTKTALQNVFGKKEFSTGIAWANGYKKRLLEEGSAEWGIMPENIGRIDIVKREEIPKSTYFGASPTNIQTVLNKAKEALDRKGTMDPAAYDEVMKSLTDVLVDMTKGNGFMSHARYRENVPGWETMNLQQTIREEISQYASYMARSQFLEHSVEAMKLFKGQPKLLDYASKLIKDLSSGLDETGFIGNTMKGFAYWSLMAGKLSTIMLQITQNFIMAAPRLGMEGVPRAARQLVGAMKDVGSIMGTEMKNYFSEGYRRSSPEEIMKILGAKRENVDLLARGLHEAQLSGATWSNFVNQFVKMEQEVGNKLFQSVKDASAIGMRLMEEMNRRSTFLVAMDHNLRQIMGDMAKTGKEMSREEIYREAFSRSMRVANDSHIIYDKANMPQWARSGFAEQFGRGFYVLKNFTHNYMQFMTWMAKNDPRWGQVGYAMTALAGMGGLNAIPGLDTIAGWAFNKEGVTWNEKLEDYMGRKPAQVLMNGPLGLMTNFGERLNPINGSLFSTTTGSMWESGKNAVKDLQRGQYLRGMAHTFLSPALATQMYDAYEAYNDGKLTKQGKLMSIDGKPIKFEFTDAMQKVMGFTPYMADTAQWYRERAKDQYWNEEKSNISSTIRFEYDKTGKISDDNIQKFMDVKYRASMAGRPMSVKGPYQLTKRSAILQDY